MQFSQALQKIASAQNILLTTHQKPDGDAFGSLCAFIDFLENLDKSKKFFAFAKYKNQKPFEFLPHIHKIQNTKPSSLKSFDLIIIFDSSSIDRTDMGCEIRELKNTELIEFDHHPKIENINSLEIRNSQAASTTEVLYDFFMQNKIVITKNMATAILTGILTDTANLLYPSTTTKTLEITSHMMRLGAQFPKITKKTWQNKSLNSMKIWGEALNNLEINQKYNLAFSVLSRDIIDNITKEEDSDDIFSTISGFLSNLYGVKAIIFLREEEKGKIKGSLRSGISDFNVLPLAQILGGGGHNRASGFMLDGQIKKIDNKWRIL